jgi:hypothetical protein
MVNFSPPPGAESSLTVAATFGVGPGLKVDFARLVFQVPTHGSVACPCAVVEIAANAVASKPMTKKLRMVTSFNRQWNESSQIHDIERRAATTAV